MHLTTRHIIAAVLTRFDSPGMRADLARWYEVAREEVDRIAHEIERARNENHV